MGKHTPGPWSAPETWVNVIGLSAIPVEAPPDLAVAFVLGPTDDADTAANAALISAAPELLAACQMALAKLESLDAENNLTGLTLERAIAKATNSASARGGGEGGPG